MSASGSYQLVSGNSKYKLKTSPPLTLDSRSCTSCPIALPLVWSSECAGNVHTMVIVEPQMNAEGSVGLHGFMGSWQGCYTTAEYMRFQ